MTAHSEAPDAAGPADALPRANSTGEGGVERGLARLGRWSLIAGVVLLVEAVILTVVVASLASGGRRLLLPATVSFPVVGADTVRVVLVNVDIGAAAVVLVVIAAAGRFVWVIPPVARWAGRGCRAGRRTARWIEFSLTASITVFLVAALNGVSDVSALVPIYALTSGMVLFAVLQERALGWHGHPKLALCFGAAVGIVPWGVIAFYQVGAGVAGHPPTAAVRALTLLMLAFAFAFALTQWRELPAAPTALVPRASPPGARRPPASEVDEWMHAVIALASTSVFAWVVVLAVVVPG